MEEAMPSIGHVQKAQQRYARVPVIDPVTGAQKVRVSAKGVKTKVTENDESRPLPPFHCDYDGKEIPIGSAFKYINIKRQYGGETKRRHETCPNWEPWEYSTALWARIAQIQAMDFQVPEEADADTTVEDIASDIIEAIRELSEEKQESFDNMPEGLQQGETGERLQEAADELSNWADEFDNIDLPDYPEAEDADEDCADCEGTGEIEGDGADKVCPTCGGEGSIANDDAAPDPDAVKDWQEEVRSAIQDVLDGAPELG
jgi:rubrerythrin